MTSKHKIALFCGGSSGLGKAAIYEFLQSGWKIINLDIASNYELENLGVIFYPCDVSDFEKTEMYINTIFQNYGLIDCLVNCIRCRNQPKDCSPSTEWTASLKIDLDSYFHSTQIVCDRMKTAKSPCSVINFSSIASSCITLREKLSYHVAKSGINQMTRYFASQFGPANIRVNAIMPGLISRNTAEVASTKKEASLYSKIANFIPLRRSGSPKEVAQLALFLASSHSSFITGQSLCIDGGLSIRDQVDCIIPFFENSATSTVPQISENPPTPCVTYDNCL